MTAGDTSREPWPERNKRLREWHELLTLLLSRWIAEKGKEPVA
jgi:hypothetical protein